MNEFVYYQNNAHIMFNLNEMVTNFKIEAKINNKYKDL